MQPLKHLEDTFEVLRLDANPIVLDRENPISSIFPGRDINFWRPIVSAVLYRVAYHILEKLRQLCGIRTNSRKRAQRQFRARIPNRLT